MTKKKQQGPAAFLSYVHEDDKYGHVTTFRERLTDEVQMVVGTDFPIFQDRKDIQWGQNWKQRIEGSLDQVTFLIPVITPRFFKSPHCRAELQRFLEREKRLDRTDLILPLYYIDTPLLNDDDLRAADELAQAIASRQYADWRDLRWEPFTNPQVGRTLERLARHIRDALPHIQTTAPRPAPPPVTAKTPPPAPSTTESGEQAAERPSARNEPPTCIVNPMPHRGDFTTISEAIEKSVPGTKIIVQPGLYEESLDIDKPLEIIGEGGPGEVVVQVLDKNVLKFQTTMGRVTNLTLRQLGSEKWYAVNIAQGRLELEDCDITSQSSACVAINKGADPRLRRNRIHNGKQSGVFVYENGLGTLEDNDIFGNLLSGLEVKEGGDPVLRRNRIHNNKGAGVMVSRDGLGTLEDNDIFGNYNAGVAVMEGGSPTIRNNRINKNKYEAIWVYEGGSGTFEGNDLSDNEMGAWDIDDDCEPNVKRSNNQE